MGLFSRRTPRRALTASALKLEARRDTAYYRRMAQPWQLRALSYYDLIGEIRFASQFYAKLLSKVRFYPARQLEDGRTEPIESGPPVEILDQIQDPGGGRSRLQYDYGRLMFVTGEGVLFQDELRDVQRWRFLWKDEVRPMPFGDMWERVRYDGTPFEPAEAGRAYRFWTPHPRHSDLPDSPLQSVLTIAEELIALTSSVMATATTRMTRGVFLLPTELSPSAYGPPGDDNYDGDEDPMSNPFLADWNEHTGAQIENPLDARAKQPFLLEGAYEYLDRVRWLQTHDPQSDYMERELRKEAVHRLALGMDFPPEFLLGMTDANHWTARQVVYDMWRSYGSPIAERFGDDIADSVLRPMLEDEGYPGFEDVVVAFDDSQVVIPPDMTEIANDGLDRVAISRKGWRTLSGISDEHAPDEEEEELLVSLKLRQPIELEDGNLVIPQRGPVANGNGSDPEAGPPEPTRGRDVSRQESRTAAIVAAAGMALRNCRSKAGARMRAAVQHECPECRERTDGLPNSLVASTIGREQANSLGFIDPVKLVAGGATDFRDELLAWGVSESLTAALAQMIEVHAARTLFDSRQPEVPSGFIAQVERAKEVSDAVVSGAA